MINIVVTSCGEKQTRDIIEFLANSTNDKFNIWLLTDGSKPEENYTELKQICKEEDVERVNYPLDDNFSDFRNHIHEYIPNGEWILQLDADEMIQRDFIRILPSLLKENPEVDLYYLPRNNYVNGITDDYIKKMNWNVDDKDRINYPDWQGRLYQLKENVRWEGKVHEQVKGITNYGMLKEEWAHIDHIKDFERQKKQNEYYEKLEE